MSEQKQWLDSETVEVTKTITTSERVTMSGLRSALTSWEEALEQATEKISEIKMQLAELEAVPNRPEAIIDPLFAPARVEEVKEV